MLTSSWGMQYFICISFPFILLSVQRNSLKQCRERGEIPPPHLSQIVNPRRWTCFFLSRMMAVTLSCVCNKVFLLAAQLPPTSWFQLQGNIFLSILIQFSFRLVHPVSEGLGHLIIHPQSFECSGIVCNFTMTIHAHAQIETPPASKDLQ